MERYLADLRSRQVDADLPIPGKGPDLAVVQAGGCFLLRGFTKRPHLSPADFPDPTNLECSANRLLMDGMFDAHIIDSCPLLLLTAGLITARALSRELQQHAARFNVIVSYDGDSCAVRFHKVRAGERWLADDLEGYVDEGVLVFEAGADMPMPALLTAQASARQ